MDHESVMRRCLELAEGGRGLTGINPVVGSVLVRKGTILAETCHEAFGKRHAERAALEDFDGPIEKDDILYVNLEPCSHYGKTPPCVDLIIEKGIKTLVIGMLDPFEKAAGTGITALQSAGIEVVGPVLPDLCQRANRGFVSVAMQNRPWVTAKKACTRAGEYSQSGGSRLKITCKDQDAWSHRFLRARHDAILVGIQTVIADNPQLTTRVDEFTSIKSDQKFHSALCIVLDPELQIPLDRAIVTEPLAAATLIVTTEGYDKKKIALTNRGVEVLEARYDNESFDLNALFRYLITPRDQFHGITSILVEGGPMTWKFFEAAGVVDEEVILVGA